MFAQSLKLLIADAKEFEKPASTKKWKRDGAGGAEREVLAHLEWFDGADKWHQGARSMCRLHPPPSFVTTIPSRPAMLGDLTGLHSVNDEIVRVASKRRACQQADLMLPVERPPLPQ